jgi:hypothetical protein
MKNKLFLLLAIIAVMGIAVVLNYGKLWAQQEGPPEPFDETKATTPVEFTTFPDVKSGGGAPPPEGLFTVPPDAVGTPNPANAFTYPYGNNQVDALANKGDYLFWQLIRNRANLLVSFQGDPNYLGPPVIGPVAVFMEDNGGGRLPKWNQKEPPPLKTQPYGLDKDALTLNPSHELDALEVWGPLDSDDADMYSLQGDPMIPAAGDPERISVRKQWNGLWYIRHSTIQAAVTALGWTGDPDNIDLDALMVWNVTDSENWGTGDSIIFSIRATGNWDGGEIVVLRFGPPQTQHFLVHGGVTWNTALPIATLFNLSPATEEVDAIEAYPGGPTGITPTLTEWGVIILVALLVASTAFILLRRRKSAVPA